MSQFNTPIYLINLNTFSYYEDISINVDQKRVAVFVKKAQDLDLRMFMGKSFFYDLMQYCSNAYGIASMTILARVTTAANGNYINQPIVASTGSGIDATASFLVYNGSISNFIINEPGTGYQVGDLFTIDALPGAQFSVASLSTQLVLADNTPQNYLDLFNGADYEDKSGNNITYAGMIPALVYWTFARFIEADSFRYTSTGTVNKGHDDAQAISQKDIAKLVFQQRSVANSYANDIEEYLYNNKDLYPLWRFNERNKNSRQPGPRIRGIDRTKNNTVDGFQNNNRLGGFLG